MQAFQVARYFESGEDSHAGITSGSLYIIRWREPRRHYMWLVIFNQVKRATQALQVARYFKSGEESHAGITSGSLF